jgi:hypothetical protein
VSWEESTPIDRPCPCAAGYYAVINRSDDWGRFDERWEMHCTSCQSGYGLYVYEYNRSGMSNTHRSWLSRELLRELSSLESKLERAKQGLSQSAAAELRSQWFEHFAGKSKKAVWRELTEDGMQYPSLPTFYTHVRQSSLQRVLTRYFEYDELSTVERVLGLDNTELPVRRNQVAELEAELEAKHAYARQHAVA